MDLRDYPHIWPPPGFEPFDINGSKQVLATAAADAFTAYTIPLLQEGWITLAGIELSSYTGAFYQLVLDGKPIRNYEKVTVPLGAPNTPAVLYIKLKPNQAFTLHIDNTGAGAINTVARWRFYGWYYPKDAGR